MNRALTFIAKRYDGVIPDGGDNEGPLSLNDEQDAEFISDVNKLLHEYIDAMEAVKLRLGLQTIMLLSSKGNGYLQSAGLTAALMKNEPKRCAQVICRAANLIYTLGVLAEPFMPATAAAIFKQLNTPERSVPESFSIDILPGHHIGQPAHLFTLIEEKMAEIWREKFAGTNAIAQVGGLDADATHVTTTSKRKAAKAAATSLPGPTGPKSAEVIELEAKVSGQGDAVRALKAKTPKSKDLDEEVASAVAELKRLKAELSSTQKSR